LIEASIRPKLGHEIEEDVWVDKEFKILRDKSLEEASYTMKDTSNA
jgi:hypothetical protein